MAPPFRRSPQCSGCRPRRRSRCSPTTTRQATGIAAIASILALDLTAGRRGLAALGTVIVCWVKHLLDIDVMVEPLNELRDVALAWYVGLDANGTRIGDALWNGAEIDEATRARVVGLFRLTFRDAGIVIDRMAGEPVYLILAMTPDKILRMKPQNLLTGLPIRRLETVT